MTKPFLVYTGNLYPHKNVGVLIQAAERLKINVDIVCARSVFERRLTKSSYVRYLGRLSDQDLIKLYKQASAFVFPSLIEGFGLTGLEAMSVGLPVLASNATVLPEIYGDAAVYFDPRSQDQFVHQLERFFSDQGKILA